MRHQILLPVLLAGFVISCNSENSHKTTADSAAVVKTDTSVMAPTTQTNTSDCYEYIKNRDTAALKLNITGDELTGDLSYKLFEKDSNKGKIAGELKGDTIIAEYTFDSEGLRSVREVIFVKQADGKLYEGTGEVEEKGGKMMFKNRSALKFGQSIVFSKADCK
jgi:hypothetical protein